jgi:hypothetical protein
MSFHATRTLRRSFKVRDSAVGASRHVTVVPSTRCSRAHVRSLESINCARHRPPVFANRYPIR